MAVFKHSGVVVTTPSSGTYVIECIGNVGALADLLDERVAEVGVVVSSETAGQFSASHPRNRLGKHETTPRGFPVAKRPMGASSGLDHQRVKKKREPSKTKAAIAAAKRRARLKAEKVAAQNAAEEAAAANGVTALIGTRRGNLARAAHHPSHGLMPGRFPGVPISDTPSTAPYEEEEFDEEKEEDVEDDIAEAAEAMGRMNPLETWENAGFPPDSYLVPSEEDDDQETALVPPSVEDTGTASGLFRTRLLRRMIPGAVFAFDAREAAVCEMRGWDDVLECQVRKLTKKGVDVACRTRGTNTHFMGAYRVPLRVALRVLVDRNRVPAFPSGAAERRRAAAAAAAEAAARAAGALSAGALSAGVPGVSLSSGGARPSWSPSSGALARRALAQTRCDSAEREIAAVLAAGRKRPREEEELYQPARPFPARTGGADAAASGFASSLEREVASFAREMASFRRETRAALSSLRAIVERLASELRRAGGPRPDEPPEAKAPDEPILQTDRTTREETFGRCDAHATRTRVGSFSESPFEASTFVAEARALATLRDEPARASAAAERSPPPLFSGNRPSSPQDRSFAPNALVTKTQAEGTVPAGQAVVPEKPAEDSPRDEREASPEEKLRAPETRQAGFEKKGERNAERSFEFDVARVGFGRRARNSSAEDSRVETRAGATRWPRDGGGGEHAGETPPAGENAGETEEGEEARA
jgi:hypothetical protein